MSGDDGLRSAFVSALDAEIGQGWSGPPGHDDLRELADVVLALPEFAALRAKAAAADRVEALVSAWTNMAQPQSWGTKLYAIRRALDVSDRTDRGRC